MKKASIPVRAGPEVKTEAENFVKNDGQEDRYGLPKIINGT